MATDSSDITVAVLGARRVGKSALTVRLLTKRFIGEYDSSSVSTYRGEIKRDTESIKFTILDYPGDHDGLNTSIFSSTDCCVVVYSVTDSNSLSTAINYVQTICEYNQYGDSLDVIILLLGNKKELTSARQVTLDEGKAVAANFGCAFFEVSAAEDFLNVQSVFEDLLIQVQDSRIREKRQRKLSAKKKAAKLFRFGGRIRSGTL